MSSVFNQSSLVSSFLENETIQENLLCDNFDFKPYKGFGAKLHVRIIRLIIFIMLN